jgi:CheY-like chemotaxis protein
MRGDGLQAGERLEMEFGTSARGAACAGAASNGRAPELVMRSTYEPTAIPPPDARLTRRAVMAHDDRDERNILGELLRNAGIDVIAVADGDDVLNAVAAWRPSVVLLGWPLQEGGLKLVRRLVEEQGMGGRVILISSLCDPRDQHAAFRAGVAHYLMDPADPDQLIAAVRSAT